MINSLILDLNGVLVTGVKLSDVLQDYSNVSVEVFLPALADVMGQARQPNAPEIYGLWEPYFAKWGVKMSEEELYKKWFHAEEENKELTNYLRTLKEGNIKLIVLSNNFRERTAYYNERFPFLKEIFDRVYYSWETGFVKPDSRALMKVLEDFSLKPDECLYFDDLDKNIAVAKELGIHAYLYKNVDDIKEKLNGIS